MKREKCFNENYKTFSNFKAHKYLFSPVIRPKKEDDSILTSPMNLSKFKNDRLYDFDKNYLSEEELYKAKLSRREKLNELNIKEYDDFHISTPKLSCKNYI